jgi:Tfp pilus assembly protein PilX
MNIYPARRGLSGRFRAEAGFTMIIALGVLTVTMLLAAAAFSAVQGEAPLTRADLDGKRAYAAAESGLQAYLYSLNNNSSTEVWFETCANDTTNGSHVPVPGAITGVTYSYRPVVTCDANNLVGTLIDPSTGTLRMEFTGYAGTGCATASSPCQQRTVVASFQTLSPLSFLWYTVHETIDTSLVQYLNNGNPDSTCTRFYRARPGPDPVCDIFWGPNDAMNGPMYTQDQYLVEGGASPTFASEVPTTNSQDICANSNCQGAKILGTSDPAVSPTIPLPTDNKNLRTDASHGLVLYGTTTLTISGTQATGWNCQGTTTSATCTPETIDLTQVHIIYDANVSSACTNSYNPVSVTYRTNKTGQYYGVCGDIYVQGSYSTPLTIAAENDVVLTGSLTNSTDPSGNTSPTGSATLGLVADWYVRVMHPCNNGGTSPDVTFDAAILTLKDSFFVDNYTCDNPGTLTIHGALAQQFRGAVGTSAPSGYVKNYNYDDRLGVILPPYLFDLQSTAWAAVRETLCSQTAPSTSTNSCGYTGP